MYVCIFILRICARRRRCLKEVFLVKITKIVISYPRCVDSVGTCICWYMNNHIYSTLFKIQERKSDRKSKEIEQRKESQNTHKTRTDM